MNRPRLMNLLSAALGSTSAFLVLSRWSLIGTITGAILMPVIFTLVSFSSQESIARVNKWARYRLKNDSGRSSADAARDDDPGSSDEATAPAGKRSLASRLQWSVAVLAFLAFAVSLYSLTNEGAAGVTILREKVVQTVTVTSEQSAFTVARTDASETLDPTEPAEGAGEPTTTSTTDPSDQDDSSTTTVTTVEEDTSTTTLP